MERIMDVVAEAHRIGGAGVLWPGFDLAAIPILLYGTEEAWLIGHPAPPEGYGHAGEVAGRPVYRGPVRPELAGNTAAPVGGHLTALVNLSDSPPTDPGALARLILHEAFHVFQQTAFPDLPRMDAAALQAMAAYPENDPANNAMAIVENRLLARALEGDPAAPGAFVSMRQHRHRQLVRMDRGDAVVYEQTVEWVEGTPTYVELKAGAPTDGLVERLQTHNLGGRHAAYRRFYDTGAAQALLLDRVAPGWQARIADAGGCLQRLLEESLTEPLPPVNQVVVAEGLAALLEAEQEAEAERQARIAALLRQLDEGPGLAVEIRLPPEVQGLMWDPTNLLTISPGRRLHTRFCGAVGPDGLRVTIHALCLEEWGERGRRFRLRLPGRPEVQRGGRLRIVTEALSVDAPYGHIEEEPGLMRVQLWLSRR
ncbi:hypothetical protein [Symbiobacterium thermophilum]|uniref:Uncharacterized protein n=1 Tax=Symbiobacterium thermophilum (strain DSM 24528 / JCM 14929 / IAM 14863 / T) TaxID=292459 RepID=Q67MV0_SYMTH|nr:hypothetical protein [Symbiobacterium thermophilum]BAD40993.1 conserved hypothetical protein [Symbiobacterium thermophilum IAM 14863]